MLASIETFSLTKLLCPVSILIVDMYSFKVPMFYFKHSFMIPTALFLFYPNPISSNGQTWQTQFETCSYLFNFTFSLKQIRNQG